MGMTINRNAMRAMSLPSIVMRLGLGGAMAGLGAWVLVWVLRMLVDGSSPSGMALLLAIPRGAIFGMILGLVLHTYWKRNPGRD
jgi:hypothetical protein